MGDWSVSAARILAAAAAITALFALWATQPARAEEVSGQELESLARRAAQDSGALDRLRRVDRVDGRRVDLRRALDAPGPQAAQRALVLASDGVGPPAGPEAGDAAGRDARDILGERRFQPRRAPKPLAGVLRRIGGWLRPVGEPLGRLVGRLGAGAASVVAAAAVVAGASLVGLRMARRRTAANVAALRSARWGTRPDPRALERRADQAERDGELDEAFRLRFEAGLLRLDEAGRLRFRASLTTGEVLRQVPNAALGELARTLEEIVYGGRPASERDLEVARSGWPRVLEDTGL